MHSRWSPKVSSTATETAPARKSRSTACEPTRNLALTTDIVGGVALIVGTATLISIVLTSGERSGGERGGKIGLSVKPTGFELEGLFRGLAPPFSAATQTRPAWRIALTWGTLPPLMSLVQLRTKASPERPRRAQTGLFLPTTREEMDARGWDELDILIVTGDAYVDHPAFGAVADRALPRGARLPRRRDRAAATGTRPTTSRAWGGRGSSSASRAGNLDSMLNKLTAQKKVRSRGPVLARRPHRACARTARRIVYSNLCRQAFPGVPIVLGGIEASLRRIAHYDYWSRSGAPLDPARREGRPARLRHGRAPGVGDRASASTAGETRRAAHATCAAPRT